MKKIALISEHMPLVGPYAAGNFLRGARACQAIRIAESFETIRSYIDGCDMDHWILTLLHRGQRGNDYNAGSDQPVSALELVTAIREVVGTDQPIEVCDPAENSGCPVYLPSIWKAGDLGMRIETPLRTALAQVVRTLQAAPRPNLHAPDFSP
jgi:nucleoside-diphosphate-sugar epimerase